VIMLLVAVVFVVVIGPLWLMAVMSR